MDKGTALEMIKSVPVVCEKCGSKKLLVFFERKIDNCFATACLKCEHFQIYGKDMAALEQWFKDHSIE